MSLIPKLRASNVHTISEEKYALLDAEENVNIFESDENSDNRITIESDSSQHQVCRSTFSWFVYLNFSIIGLSMMWTWCVIIAGAPYFALRFQSNPWILQHFQAFNLVTFSTTILATDFILTKLQNCVSYPCRLYWAIAIYTAIPLLLALSTLPVLTIPPLPYFVFILLLVFVTAIGNGISQNAAFAFAAGFDRLEYTPGISMGEVVAAIMPCVIEIISILSLNTTMYANSIPPDHIKTKVAFWYFFSGSLVAICSLVSLQLLVRRRTTLVIISTRSKTYGLRRLWNKLCWVAAGNFLCLCFSSITPVVASRILPVSTSSSTPALLQPAVYIPLALLLWNVGDLLGSVFTLETTVLVRSSRCLFGLSLARIGFIPLFLLCNIDGRGSWGGNLFYLAIQFLFGVTHGYFSSTCMLAVTLIMPQDSREEAGGFMGLSLVFGLAVGSLLGLVVAEIL